MFAPLERKSAAVARQAGSQARVIARGTPSSPFLRADRQERLGAVLNARPQVRQLKSMAESLSRGRAAIPSPAPVQKGPNRTGLPDRLKAGVETLAGVSLEDVKVHYNSARPAALNALAYTQGSDIHVAPGQEEHLPHEAWHAAQQKQGRVKPTLQAKGIPVNDDDGLEREADAMGARARTLGHGRGAHIAPGGKAGASQRPSGTAPIQGYQLRNIDESRSGISDLHYRYDDDIGGNAKAGEHLHITVAAGQPAVARHCYYNYTTTAWRWDTQPAAAIAQIVEANQADAIDWAKPHRPKPAARTAPAPAPAAPKAKLGKMPRKGAKGTVTTRL